MKAIRVWAPKPERVELEIAGVRTPMQQRDGGWWEAETDALEHGVDYAFALDGEGPFPDPRSPWQPAGVHGASRMVDHDRFAWSDDAWQPGPFSSALVYELHVGTFTPEGTFDGAIGKLDYLKELGVTHVELMPVNAFPGARGWGYDGVDLYAPHEAYGGPEGLKRLVNACHERGLAVVLDVVYNHLGPSGNYLEKFGPYFTERYATPWGKAVNLDDAGSDEVRRFFIDNALMWLRDYHIDALRVDAVHAIYDQSAIHFLEQLATEVEALQAELGRHLTLIAESDLNDPRVVRRREVGGFGMDAQWSDDFHHALHALLSGERDGYYVDFGSMEHLARALQRAYVYDGRRSPFRQRVHGRPVGDLSGHRFLGYLQNHDQVGNRAQGDRSSHLLDEGRLKIGAALVLCSPFVPMLFQGEEWAASSPFQYFTDHRDAALGDAVSEGRRREFAAFGWAPEDVPDPQAEATFGRSKLQWDEREREPHRTLLEWHRKLIRLRRAAPELADGDLGRVEVECDETAGWFLLRRGEIVVAFNIGSKTQTFGVQKATDPGVLLIASTDGVKCEKTNIVLPPDAVAVLGPGRHRNALDG